MTDNRYGCERSEQHSRAERVNPSNTHKDRMSFRQLRNVQDAGTIHKAIIHYQFQEIFHPHWFGTIQWKPFITDYNVAVKEATHFNNKFFCALLKTKLKHIPDPPARPRIIWFHEKAPMLINPKNPKNPRYRTVYHSHFHLEQCPDPYDSWIQLDWLIHSRVARGFHRFSTSRSKNNQGFILKPWIREHHANYNLKDYYRYKHDQESDLVLDYLNSDLKFSSN